ncbi:ResB protein required for cytochrome C biosynthesis [Candidatus Marinamargulisbacteria bacterium SCGC AG-410-N11]|nr:ResB protein required for cytochrome C biosynthesis [Candidatus Marinamargulisbacteria bacterium SCGC AG-410-N11]
MIKKIIQRCASLTISNICLSGFFVLVFWSTMSQTKKGIFIVQKEFFQSFFIWWAPVEGIKIPIFIGGLIFGGLLVINLIASIIYHRLYKFKKWGLFLVHVGLLMLLLGGWLSSLLTTETQMKIKEGQTQFYSESSRAAELVFIDRSNPAHDRVISIPDTLLAKQGTITHPDLPFSVRIDHYYLNAQLTMRQFTEKNIQTEPLQGVGSRLIVNPLKPVVKDELMNLQTAKITLLDQNQAIGSWLVSMALNPRQSVTYKGKTYDLSLRQARYYNPYSLTLTKFTHERYPGTDIPKSFSSAVILDDPEMGENRNVLIYMNHPLRYRGKTFFQASFGENDTLTVFQVVENPLWLEPYISSILIAFGLLLHFIIRLGQGAKKRV